MFQTLYLNAWQNLIHSRPALQNVSFFHDTVYSKRKFLVSKYLSKIA